MEVLKAHRARGTVGLGDAIARPGKVPPSRAQTGHCFPERIRWSLQVSTQVPAGSRTHVQLRLRSGEAMVYCFAPRPVGPYFAHRRVGHPHV
ncbi:MAG: hypothetical protein WBA12_06265 [Catalinimonas sp.]